MNELTPDVRDFIARNVSSLGQLEVLLCLNRSRNRTWSVPDLNRELRSQQESIAHWLDQLVASGLAARQGQGFRAAGSPDTDRTVNALAIAYDRWPTRVAEFLYSQLQKCDSTNTSA